METMGMRLSVVKQSLFGPPGQYGRLVTRANIPTKLWKLSTPRAGNLVQVLGLLGHILCRILTICPRLVESAILSPVEFWAPFKMSDFGFPSSSSSNSSSGLNGSQRAELMEQVKSQLLVASLQELLSVRHDRNYTCVPRVTRAA